VGLAVRMGRRQICVYFAPGTEKEAAIWVAPILGWSPRNHNNYLKYGRILVTFSKAGNAV
jgi:hypothetical protein